MDLAIEPCASVDQPGWLELRLALWPEGTPEAFRAEMAGQLADPGRFAQFVACADDGRPVGLAEASLRLDHVNGTSGSPVAFLEGLYVVPEHRRRGVAARLVAAVEAWALARGAAELASDVLVENVPSQRVHRALGFRETERVVFYCKPLRRD